MSQHKRTIERLRKRPIDVNIRYEDVETLLLRLGFVVVNNGTSHCKFRHENCSKHISIKKQKNIATYSVEDVCDALDELEVDIDV